MIRQNLIEIAKSLYSGKQNTGRKLKPKNVNTLIKTHMRNCQNKPIATLGMFSKLPTQLAMRIHDKKLCPMIETPELKQIAQIILREEKSPNIDVRITSEGRDILDDLICNRLLTNAQLRRFNLRTIFTTQERQIILG